ncbi:hypothetical protein ACQ4PT_002499 [Festuca glaucescens]
MEQSMAAAAASRPFLLLDDRAVYDEYSDWEMVECECQSKVAYGCGPLGQQIVEGLTLLADLRSGDDDEGGVPSLAVHATNDVLGRFEEEVPGKLGKKWGWSLSEIDDELLKIVGTKVNLSASVEAVDDEAGVLVLCVSFHHEKELGDLQSHHLVYDRETASLSLLPYVPTHCEAAYTSCPLLVRHQGDGGYSLVLTAVEAEQHDELGRPVLCSWTPQSPSLVNGGVGPWQIRQRRHATAMPDRFGWEAQAFTYKGKAFWADLTQGILYCECADLVNDCDDASAVEFTFVALPEEYRIEELEYKHRAMGVGVGDSVWFVVLESCDHPGDTTVVVLSLDLSDGAERRWERHLELSLLSIWALEGFVEAGLPRRVPWSPFLREQDAGVMYLLLPRAVPQGTGCHLIGIDVCDSSEPRLVRPRRLGITPWIFNQQPMLLAPDFFDRRRNDEEALNQMSI